MEKHKGLIVCADYIIEDGETIKKEDFLAIVDQKKGKEIESKRVGKEACASFVFEGKIYGFGKTEKEAKADLYKETWERYCALKREVFAFEAILSQREGHEVRRINPRKEETPKNPCLRKK